MTPRTRNPRKLARMLNWSAARISDPLDKLRFLQQTAPAVRIARRSRKPLLALGVLPLVLLAVGARFLFFQPVVEVHGAVPALPRPVVVARDLRPVAPVSNGLPSVWQVERSRDSEMYSNGLRIDTRHAVSHRRRSYLAFPLTGGRQAKIVQASVPVGIVFHTTESRQAPFEAQENKTLRKLGESILDYVRRKRAYNYLIDRFGRVYRVVEEADAANHAGYSVWGDAHWLYVNLNDSFLGVSFEAATEAGQTEATISPAQVRAASMLSEMLRSRYRIEGVNCVTHAQVSVNPSNMRVGLHVDWASSFPFEQLGLPDNYSRPLPAVTEFGFVSDTVYLYRAGTRIAVGAETSDEIVRSRATAADLTLLAYRKRLRVIYKDRLRQMHRLGIADNQEGE